jgi:hypothetical protein
MHASLTAIITARLFAAAGDSASTVHVADIRCENIALTRIGSDSAEFELTLSGTASKSLTVESIFFDRVTVNGIPLRVSPARGPFRFRKGQPIDGLPTLLAVANFRQIPSLDPIRSMIDDETAHVHVDLLVRLDLNPIEMIALRAKTVWVSADVDQDVPISLPGGKLGKIAALAALTAAGPAWELSGRGREWQDSRDSFTGKAERAARRSLVEIETVFTIHYRSEGNQTLTNHSLGFILPSGRILTVEEAIEPWIYAPTLAQDLTSHRAVLDVKSVEIIVRLVAPTAGSPAEFSLRKGQLRLLKQRPQTAHVALRSTTENSALIELKGIPAAASAFTLANDPGNDEWQTAAVFRYDSASGLIALVTEVKQEDGRYILRDASPDSAGSPIWLESGAAGMLQDDSSAVFIGTVLRDFPSESF